MAVRACNREERLLRGTAADNTYNECSRLPEQTGVESAKKFQTEASMLGLRKVVWKLYYRRSPEIAVTGILLNLSILRAMVSSRILRRRTIHVIGDSHTKIFRQRRPFRTYHVGPSTAYKLASDHSTFHSKQRLFRVVRWAVRRDDRVILVFGEIDCRIHIYNTYMKNEKRQAISELIGDTITRYGGVLDTLKRAGVNLFVYSVPPVGEAENIFGYTHYASIKTRSAINREFNALLNDRCTENGYEFIDVYSKVVDENGLIVKEYEGDEVHLNDMVVDIVLEQMQVT